VATGIGTRSIDVEEGDLAVGDGLGEFFDADVLVLTGDHEGAGSKKGCKEGEELS